MAVKAKAARLQWLMKRPAMARRAANNIRIKHA